MSLTFPNHSTLSGARLSDRVRVGAAALFAMARALRNRRAARHIADLPDSLLSDIGLKRDDVHHALGANWRTDPTYLLAVRAGRRRRGA